jgi:hypothetical protein
MFDKLAKEIGVFASATAMLVAGCGVQDKDTNRELQELREQVNGLKQKDTVGNNHEQESRAEIDRNLGIATKKLEQNTNALIRHREMFTARNAELDRELELSKRALSLVVLKIGTEHLISSFSNEANIEKRAISNLRYNSLKGLPEDLKLAKETLVSGGILSKDGYVCSPEQRDQTVKLINQILEVIEKNGWDDKSQMQKTLQVLKSGTEVKYPALNGEYKPLEELGIVNPVVSPLLKNLKEILSHTDN